jgi:hypothetical protein
MRSIWTCGLVVLGGAAVLLAGQVRSQPATSAPDKSEFQGKILAVSLRSATAVVVLEKALIRPLAGQPFLVGKYLDDPSVKGPRGRTTWLALIDVVRIVEFDDVEQLKKAYENSER